MVKLLIEGMTGNYGGKETYIMNLFKAMDHSKYDCTFISYDNRMAYESYVLEKGASVIHLPARNQGLIEYRKAIKQLLEQTQYDVIWAHKTTLSSCELLSIGRKYGIPIRIIHSHSSSNMGGRLTFIMHNINKMYIGKWATDFFACSEVAAKWFFGNRSCTIMKNCIDVEKFRYNANIRKQVRMDLGVDNCYVIGHVGRFGIEKNHVKLINVFNEIKKIKKNACLVLCGDGEERSNIEQLIKDYRLEKDVYLLGVVHNINEIVQAFDIMVMPSLFEGLPYSLIEAQASGLKCVVSDTVSRESDILEMNSFLPLSLPDRDWAKVIVDNSIKYNRSICAEVLKNKGFDIKDCVKLIEQKLES